MVFDDGDGDEEINPVVEVIQSNHILESQPSKQQFYIGDGLHSDHITGNGNNSSSEMGMGDNPESCKAVEHRTTVWESL